MNDYDAGVEWERTYGGAWKWPRDECSACVQKVMKEGIYRQQTSRSIDAVILSSSARSDIITEHLQVARTERSLTVVQQSCIALCITWQNCSLINAGPR